MLKKRYFKTKDEWEVTFEYPKKADRVSLVSQYNNWQPVEMKQRKKDRVFYTKVRLPNKSQYQYRYLINDQKWENDEAADSYVTNEFGSDNSIVQTYD